MSFELNTGFPGNVFDSRNEGAESNNADEPKIKPDRGPVR